MPKWARLTRQVESSMIRLTGTRPRGLMTETPSRRALAAARRLPGRAPLPREEAPGLTQEQPGARAAPVDRKKWRRLNTIAR